MSAEKDDGADRRIDDRGSDADTQMNVQSRQQPAADERAGNSHDDVAEEAEAGAAHDMAGQPSGNQTDDENDDETFA